jgi:peptide/nickel transport system substrate-binding protein
LANYWNQALSQRVTRRRGITTVGAGAMGAAFLAACGGSDSGGSGGSGSSGAVKDASGLLTTPVDTIKEAKRGGTLKRNFNSDFPSLDPSANNSGSSGLYESVFARLIAFKPGILKPGQEDEIVPEVAESWEISPDKMTIVFKIRQGVKFHNIAPVNGREMDVQDIIFSWDRFARVGGQRSGVANSVNPNAPIMSVTATDARTVTVKVKEPIVYALGMFGARENINLVPKEGADANVLDLRNKMIGAGPYYLSDYTRSVGFTMKRNTEYFDKNVAFVDQIDGPIITEYAQQAAQFRNGNIMGSIYNSGGTMGFQIRQEEVLATKKDVPALNLYLGEINAIGNRTIFGWKTAALRDERVRQAFSMAYDRDLWIEVQNNFSKFEAAGLPIERKWYSAFPSMSPSYTGWNLDPRDEKNFGPNAKYYKHDIAEAKKLMAAAGFASGLELNSTYTRGTEYGVNFHKEVEVRQGFGADIGIKYNNIPVDYQTEFIPKYRDSSGNYEGISYRSGPPATSSDPVAQILYWYHSKAGNSFFGFDVGGKGDFSGDPKVDADLTKASQEFDTAKRQALITDLVKYLGQKQYAIQGVGGASNFDVSWPALQNFNAYRGNSASHQRTQHNYWWLDQTKAPFK